MPADVRCVRVSLPRALLEKLALRAAAEARDLNAVIVRAVAAELRHGPRPPSPPRLPKKK